MQQSCLRNTNGRSAAQETPHLLYKLKGLVPRSQHSTTVPCTAPNESCLSTFPRHLFQINFYLPFFPRLSLPSMSFHSGFPNKVLHKFLTTSTRANAKTIKTSSDFVNSTNYVAPSHPLSPRVTFTSLLLRSTSQIQIFSKAPCFRIPSIYIQIFSTVPCSRIPSIYITSS
jgi:hypothetical protein